jgi:hypothetical protein
MELIQLINDIARIMISCLVQNLAKKFYNYFGLCYVSNATLHADLGISYVHEVIHQKCNKHQTRLGTHENPLLKTLLLREENRRQQKLAN